MTLYIEFLRHVIYLKSTLVKAAAPGNTSLRPNLAWKHRYTKLETSGSDIPCSYKKGPTSRELTYRLTSSFHHYCFISVFIGDVDRSWTCIHLYTTSIWESFTSISLQFFPTNEAITPREAEQLTRSAKCLSQMVVKNVFFAVASCINKYNFHEPIINPPSNHIKSYQTYSYIFRSFWRRFESFGLAVGRDGLSFWAFPGLGLAKVHQPMWGLSGKDMEGRKTVEHDKLLHGQHMVKLWLQSKIRRIPFQSEVCASLTFWHQRGTDSCVNASNCWSLAGSTHLHLGK